MPSSPPKTVTTRRSFGQLEDLGEELPGEGDGVFFEVVAEAEVAEHLEERVVARGDGPTFSRSLCLPLTRMHFWLEVGPRVAAASRGR